MRSKETREILFGSQKKEQCVGISSGSTLLNLACTDSPDYAYLPGCYYYVVGDSASGKSWLGLSCLAEATLNPAFEDYLLVFDDVEGGLWMDIERYFGRKTLSRLRPPNPDPNTPFSSTVEDFYRNIANLLDGGKPFLYVLDSQDALTSQLDLRKFEEQRKFGEEAVGSYGDGKAKYHSQHLRVVVSGLREKRSILLILGQTRDFIGHGFGTRTRAGGRALQFYATLEIWTSVHSKVRKSAGGKERTIGVRCLAEIKKNRMTGRIGKDNAVLFSILYDYGLDDIGSCVDYLLDEGVWENKRGWIDVSGKGKMTRDQLIKSAEDGSFDVRRLVAEHWRKVQDEIKPVRAPRYVV